MPDFRAYAPAVAAGATDIRLEPDESHHLVTVNRCSRGDPVVAFDGQGREWLTECVDPAKHGALLHIKETRPARTRTFGITLAQALPKGATMDDIVRQATEIGAVRVIPVITERTQVHLDGDRAGKKIEKWRTTAIEAAKQCGNPWLPEIAPVQTMSAVLADTLFDLKLIASLHAGARSLHHVLAAHAAKHGGRPKSVLWLVGPEGDFSPTELTAAITAGCVPITLGPLVLRSDTAAVYALSILSHELAEL